MNISEVSAVENMAAEKDSGNTDTIGNTDTAPVLASLAKDAGDFAVVEEVRAVCLGPETCATSSFN
jgi:hypothetical protein